RVASSVSPIAVAIARSEWKSYGFSPARSAAAPRKLMWKSTCGARSGVASQSAAKPSPALIASATSTGRGYRPPVAIGTLFACITSRSPAGGAAYPFQHVHLSRTLPAKDAAAETPMSLSTTSSPARLAWPLLAALGLHLALAGLLLRAALAQTGGHLIYGLDDAYIHLAIA